MKKFLIKLFGHRYIIKYVDWIKEDEIICLFHRMYVYRKDDKSEYTKSKRQ